jgi:hypothetical protein
MRRLNKEYWPHKLTVGVDEFAVAVSDMEDWLRESVGEFKQSWNVVYLYNQTDFYFHNEQDLLMFSLRWS